MTGGDVDVTKEGILYARFHVRTPDAYLNSTTRASADPDAVAENSNYYTMFVLGGDATSERGAGGLFGGYKVAFDDGTDPTNGVLFFGVRGATAAEDVLLTALTTGSAAERAAAQALLQEVRACRSHTK